MRLSPVLVLGLAALLAGCGSHPAADHAVQIRAAADTSTPAAITINPSTGQTFTPTASETPALTAAQAWATFARHGNNRMSQSIPAGTTAQLGLVTLPAGLAGAPGTGSLTQSNGEAYTALNQLAWGFSSKQCGPVMPPVPVPGSSPAPVPAPSNCVEWLFLDANTGAQIDMTWQQ